MKRKQKKPSDYIQEADVVCPFYCQHVVNVYSYVVCEGIVEHANMVNRFRKNADLANFMRKYCCRMNDFRKCPIYKIVAQTYKEDI